MSRYKTQMLQKIYDGYLEMAADQAGPLYTDGVPHRGGSHRCAFWDGYYGVRSPFNVPGSPAAACYQAGRKYAKINPGYSVQSKD